MTEFTVKVAGATIPTTFRRILTSEDTPAIYVELAGPEDAFEIREGDHYDQIKVVDPDRVTVNRYRRIA